MIARLRCYSGLREAWAEWDRLGVPHAVDDELELFTKAFAFVEGADPDILDTFAADVEDLGGKAFRCDTTVTRMLVAGTRDLFLEIKDTCSPAADALTKAIANYWVGGLKHIRMGGREMTLDRTLVMGILNVTPDSFADGGLYADEESAVRRAIEMADSGADIIDVGGESTRPFSEPVPESEELDRIIPVIRRLSEEADVLISVDTRRPSVASKAIEAGAVMVNDVSGLRDPEMISMISDADVPVVLMHMRGEPKTMQRDIHYDDVIGDIMMYFHGRLETALDMGVDPKSIVLDPGIGFGKTVENNLEIIRRLREFGCMGHPILVGPSRKSFIGKILGLPVQDRVEGTMAAVVASIMNGASIVRVHDVKEAVRASRMTDALVKC
jgi:dihydropteroate synthase